MDKNFSWMQIHAEGNNYSLYLYNKNGLVKKVFSHHSLEIVQHSMERRNKFNEKLRESLAQAVQKAMDDPEVLKRLQKKG